MFVEISGFADSTHGIRMPGHLRCQTSSLCDARNVTRLALVRWLVSHPLALDRDYQHRPICPPPFDINHALWTFARTRVPRWTRRAVQRQLDMFSGDTETARHTNALRLSRAFYDLVHVDSMKHIMNCTSIDNDSDLIMQTITLPFQSPR